MNSFIILKGTLGALEVELLRISILILGSFTKSTKIIKHSFKGLLN